MDNNAKRRLTQFWNIFNRGSLHVQRFQTLITSLFDYIGLDLKLNTLLVLIFAGTYFRGDRDDRISRVYIFADLSSKCCKNPQNCQKVTEFSKIIFFAGTNFRKLCKKPQNPGN